MEVPTSFLCPITGDVMRDPVLTAAQQTYERSAIEAWFALGRRTDPLTRQFLQDTALTPNYALRSAVEEFLSQHAAVSERLAQLEAQRPRVEGSASVVPRRFIDPVTFAIMREPVRADDGRVYERRSIARWISECEEEGRTITSPTTGQPMGPDLTEDSDLQQEIAAFWSRFLASPHGNADEEDEEEVASVRDLCKVFSVLDQVRDILHETLGEWEPPRLVVLGAENSGKSTLLERLCLMPLFPHDRKICTRMAVRLSIRRAAVQLEPTLEVWDVANKRRVGGVRSIPLASSENAIKSEMDQIISDMGSASAGVSLDRELRITLVSPHLPPMNLIDLPGLVESPPALREQTRALAERHIAEHLDSSLFLVVLSAESNPNTSAVLAMVQERGLAGRTVGVFTKCDKLSDEDDEDFERLHEMLLGGVDESVRLEPHGYVATSNKRARATRGEGPSSTLLRQARDEVRFFREHGFEEDIVAGRATTQGLINRINAMYLDHVRASWVPRTVSKLAAELEDCRKRQRQLGLPAGSGDLEGEALQQLSAAASAAALAALASWNDKFSTFIEAEVLRPLQDALPELLPIGAVRPGGELGFLGAAQERVLGLCREAVVGLEVFDDEVLPALEEAFAADASGFRLRRFPGFLAELREALRSAVRRWDALLGQVADFLRAALHPTTSPDLKLSYNLAAQPGQVEIRAPVERITNTVLFLVSASIGRGGALEMEHAVQAISARRFSAESQEREACHGERQQLQQREAHVEDAIRRLQPLQPDILTDELAAGFRREDPEQEHAQLWDATVHGPNARVSADGRQAARWNGFCEAVIVGANPARCFRFRVTQTEAPYSGGAEVGFAPGPLAAPLPESATMLAGSWVFGFGNFWPARLQVGDVVQCSAMNGSLQVKVNDVVVVECAACPPNDTVIYPVVGLYGRTQAVELLPSR